VLKRILHEGTMSAELVEENAAGNSTLPPELLQGAWRVISPIGRGDLGEVFEVEDVKTQQRAVIKLFYARYLPEAWRGLEQLARAAAQLPSQVCVRPLSFGYEPSVQRRYALSEKVEIPSLFQLVRDQGSLSLAVVTQLLQRLASGLEVAHASGMVHRNLKPTNVFFNPETRAVKVSDFGTSALQCSTPVYSGWAMTPRWAAPEGIDAKQASSPSMDVYVLGLLAFFSLTGGSPFRSFGTGSVNLTALRAELTQPFGSMEQRARTLGYRFSPDLNAWFETSLASRPDARFESVLDQASAFASLNPTVARVSNHPAKRPEPAPPPRRPAPTRPPARLLPEPKPSPRNAPSSVVPPSVFDIPERAVALVSAQPLLLMPSLSPPPPATSHTETNPAPQQVSENILPSEPNASNLAPDGFSDTSTARPVAENSLVFLVAAGGLLSICAIAFMVWLVALKPPGSGPAHTPPVPKLATQPLSPQPKAPIESMAHIEQEPDAVQPSPERLGGVRFRCEPKGCDSVYCDGKPVAVSDEPVTLSVGTHTCKAMKAGFRTSSQRFTVASEPTEKVFVQLGGKRRRTPSEPMPKKAASKKAR